MWYVNRKVPKDLRAVLKKELIRKSLRTTDKIKAARDGELESFRIRAEFENLRRKLRAENAPPTELSEISTDHAYDLIFRYFKELEKMSEDWWYNHAPKLNEAELWEALGTLGLDEHYLTGGGDDEGLSEDGSAFLNLFLKEHRIRCAHDSPAHSTLRPLFLRAQLENTRRTMDRIANTQAKQYGISRSSVSNRWQNPVAA
jgi:hypothetical protein